MAHCRFLFIVVAAGLASIVHLGAASVPRTKTVRDTSSSKGIIRTDPANASSPAKLRIDNIRLESPPPGTPRPAMLLKFDMLNEGATRVTDIAIEVAIVQKSTRGEAASPSPVIVGPFTIRGHATIESAYTVNYQLLLRNLASDCNCAANIAVVSARPIPEAGS